MGMVWTEELKLQYQNSLELLKTALGVHFNERVDRTRNISTDFDRFKSLVDNHSGNNYETIKVLGNDILSIYYYQNKDNNNAYLKSLSQYTTEHSLVVDLSNFLDGLNEVVTDRVVSGRRWQTHPINISRKEQGFYDNLITELKEYPEKFHNYTRMSVRQFERLLVLVSPLIEKSDLFRESLKPQLRLLVTLRYLGTGNSYVSLSLDYRIGISTVQGIVKTTCEALWTVLVDPYLQWPSVNELQTISNTFSRKYDFPNCIGAIDGKHCRIQAPHHSGTAYFNYKKYHSLILLAVCDADGYFTYVDVGAYGCQSDGGVFSNSSLGQGFILGNVPMPEPNELPNSNTTFGHFLIGDEAFPVSRYLLRPYSGSNLDADRTFYNKSLAKARNTIERCFGVLANRFRVFRTEMLTKEENSNLIIQACVVLHNFIGKTADANTPTYSHIRTPNSGFENMRPRRGRQQREGEQLRDQYRDFLNARRRSTIGHML